MKCSQRWLFVLCGLVAALLGQAQVVNDEVFAQSLKAGLSGLPGRPVVTIDGSVLSEFQRPVFGADVVAPIASSRIVSVEGQPFGKAIQVKVNKRTNPAWTIQLLSPLNKTPIQKGDVLLVQFYSRCLESKSESGGGHYGGFSQLPREPWTGFGSFSGTPGREWQLRYARLIASDDRAPGDFVLTFHLGQYEQTIEFGGLAVIDLGQNVDTSKLPISRIHYRGEEPDAPWRKAAQERIEKFRKGEIWVSVVDASGKPVKGAQVRVQMKRHAYEFGTFLEAPALAQSPDGEKYRETLKKLFTRVTLPMYWADWGWESERTRAQYIDLAKWASAQGFHMRGHNLIWPSWQWTPTRLKQFEKDPAKLRAAIDAAITERVTLYKQFKLDDYDVINELRDNHVIPDILGWEEPVKWFKMTHEIDPKPKLGINEYSIVAGGGNTEAQQETYEKHIRMLIDKGAQLGVIGVQCHMGEDLTPPDKVVSILDRFAKFKLPIHATEFDINTDDEITQGNYMRDFVTAFFSHPATEALVQWGFWEGQHWIPRAALYRKDWSVKPNGKAFIDLVTKQWWTDVHGTTSAAGTYKTRGFLGDYEVAVTVKGVAKTVKATLGKNGLVLKVKV